MAWDDSKTADSAVTFSEWNVMVPFIKSVISSSGVANPTTLQIASVAVTASASELNILDGVTVSTAELNYVDGVTSNIQTQLDNKAALVHTHVASDVTDFQTTVSANSDVSANTSARHNAVTLAGTPDYITLAGQVLTRNQIDLTTDVTGDLPFTNLAQLSAHSVLARAGSGTGDVAGVTMGNSTLLGRDGSGDVSGLSASTVRTLLNVADGATANTGTVTSVAVSGTDGLEVDSGSPITTSGTITLGVNKTSMLSHLNVEDGAQVNTVTLDNTVTLTNKTLTDPKINLAINTQTDNYSLVLTDSGKYIRMNKSTAVNLTVQDNSDVAFPVGTQIVVRQVGAGQVTLVEDTAVTINIPTGKTLLLRGQGSTVSLIKVATDEWDCTGDLEDA